MSNRAVGVVAAAGLAMGLGGAAMAQPATFTDLGDRRSPQQFDQNVTLTAPADIQWFKIVLPAVSAGNGFVDIWTASGGTTPMTDTEVGVYDNSGNLMASDDDDGPGLFTSLSFGLTAPTRPNGTGVAHNGRDGELAEGTYWVAVGRFNVTYGTTNWEVTSANTLSQFDTILTFSINQPVPPSGVGAAAPAAGNPNGTALFTVVVAPGFNPASTGITASMDLSGIGGSATQTLYDDGTNGDAASGDNTFSYRFTLPASAGEGTFALPWTVRDAQSRSSTGTTAFRVVVPAQWEEFANGNGDAGELPGSEQAPSGSGPLASIGGSLDGSDTDMFAIDICEPANFGASTTNSTTGTAIDTQLWLFNTDGTGIVANDDSPTAGEGTRSRLSSAFTGSLATGRYLLAISRYNRDPVDSNAALIWLNTPFNTERTPDGPGAANAVASWTGTITGNAAYKIDLTGACYPGGSGNCVADVDDGSGTGTPDGGVTIVDLLYYLVLFDAGDIRADVDNGTGTGTRDGGVTIEDLLYFLVRFDLGC